MNELAISTVSDVLGSFDMGELTTLLKAQIENFDEDYTSSNVDHFQPIYMNYLQVMENINTDDDDVMDSLTRFQNVCKLILQLIETKFGFSIEDDYINDHIRDLPAITMALYTFFVLNFYTNLREIITNYFIKNIRMLANTFMDLNTKHDAATLSNRKNSKLSEPMTVLAANMYDVTDYILSQLDLESGLEYLDEGYWPAELIRKLYLEGHADGNFMRSFADLYKTVTSLKAQISFDIIWKIKEGEIRDPFGI